MNVVRDAARLRAIGNAIHRSRNGRLRAGHPFRGRLPRQTHPSAIAASYAAEIRARAVDSIRDALRPLLDALPRLVAGHAADRAPRADAGEIDQAERLFASAEQLLEQRLGPVLLREMARRAADAAGRQQVNQLGSQLRALLGTDVRAQDRAVRAIVDQFAAENAQLISSLGKSTLDKIAKMTVRGFAAGDSASELAGKIRDQLGIAERHANLIAHDQLGKLAGQLNHARQRELGITHFVWRHSGVAGEHRRPEHVARDGKLYAYDDFNEDELPGQEISCHCFAEPVVDVSFVKNRRRR